MKVLILGADGQVGHELRGAFGCFSEVLPAGRSVLDLRDLDSLRSGIATASPDVIVNAAAYNDVDGAERDEAAAMCVNAHAVEALGEVAKRRRIALVHYSTDFVFDGEKGEPYVETDTPAPLNAYGRSKLAGEQALADAPAIVLRTSWVYSVRAKSFVSTMLRLSRDKETLRVVVDQTGSPTFCRDLAQATALILRGFGTDVFAGVEAARGVYHLAGTGSASRYELAVAALALDPRRSEQKAREVLPISGKDFPLPAARPKATPLDGARCAERFGVRLPPWRDGLARALAPSLVDTRRSE